MPKSEATHTEIQKLLHLLRAENADDFSFLEKLTKDEIAKLRIRILENAHFEQDDIWKRLAGVAKFMPSFMNAKVGETVLGPMISANLSNYLPVKDAVSVMGYMSSSYLAKVADYMIPEKSVELLNAIPMSILKKVTLELIKHKNYYTSAGFVDVLELDKIVELSKVISDENDLIAISEFVENKSCIARIVEGFSDARICKIIETAYQSNRQEDVLSVFMHLTSKETQRMLRLIASLPAAMKKKVLDDFEGRVG
ncbi:MAG TPA: hypothetical protein PLF48_02150 [Chitinophagales bacterium]|nr:hypothetical protein [Chitinophagales bacterium]